MKEIRDVSSTVTSYEPAVPRSLLSTAPHTSCLLLSIGLQLRLFEAVTEQCFSDKLYCAQLQAFPG